MKPEQFQKIKELFQAALEQEPEQRAAFLDQACQGDDSLRQELNSLLASHQQEDGFLETALLAAEPRKLKTGQRVGPYEVEREIGQGGMGVVYLAQDDRLDRRVALKALAPALVIQPKQIERLRLEARAAASLSHPAIATVYALEELEGNLYIASEYVEGETLRAQLEEGPLPPAAVLDVAVEIAAGLAAAHAQGVVHRDLKPENIVRSQQGRLKILDFGLALVAETEPGQERLTEPGTLLGTPAYMSPEQLQDQPVDFRCDLFAFGVLLYELSSGDHPFEGTTTVSTIAKILESEPRPLTRLRQEAPQLEQIILECLQKNPEDRPSSTQALLERLEELRRNIPRGSSQQVVMSSVHSQPIQQRLSLFWWVLHQTLVLVLYGLMIFSVWKVKEWALGGWALFVFFGVFACVAVNGTLRTHLLFTSRFNPGAIQGEMRRVSPWIRPVDWLFSALLVISALAVSFDHHVVGGLLAAVAIGYVVVFLVVEPATVKAVFSDQDPSDG